MKRKAYGKPSILFYWHDMWLPHSRYVVDAIHEWCDVGEVTVCGPVKRRGAASIFTVANAGDAVGREGKGEVRTKSYWWMETTCTFRDWRRLIRERRPDILVICDEALSLNVLIAGVANRLYGKGVVLFYGFENLIQRPDWGALVVKRDLPTLRKVLRKLIKATVIDKFLMPVRKRVVHGGLVSYAECSDTVRAYGWNPPMAIQWWPVNERAFNSQGERADFGLDATFVVGFVGRFIAEKGILDLLRAIASLGQHIGIVLIGDGPQKAEIEREILRLGIAERCRMLPPQNARALAASYRSINLLVLPSRSTRNWKEQYGRVLVEARMCGARTAGSGGSAIPVVVGDPEMIFPAGDVAAIADVIRRAEQLSAKPLPEFQAPTIAEFLSAWLKLASQCVESTRDIR